MDSGDRSSTKEVPVAVGVDVLQSNGVLVSRAVNVQVRVVPALEAAVTPTVNTKTCSPRILRD